jgi:glutathione S-transferase
MKLLWALMSPFVRKVMIVAHESGTANQLELIDTLVSMAEPNRTVMAINPLNKIPTLVLDDGSSLYDSRAICEYLDANGNGGLFPAGDTRWDALRRQSLGDGMMDALILWRQERLKPAARQTPEWLATFGDKIATSLDLLKSEVGGWDERAFDIGHVAIGCALGYMDVRFADLGWRDDAPRLAQWHAHFEARSSAQLTRAPTPA